MYNYLCGKEKKIVGNRNYTQYCNIANEKRLYVLCF